MASPDDSARRPPPALELAPLLAAVQAHAPRKAPEMGRAAAVLVPLLPRPDGLHLLFTERSKGLRAHAGQVSFPGGAIDPGDAGTEAAALREAHEEVGLDPAHARVHGVLDDCPTFVSGFVITPVVAVIEPAAFTAEGRYPWRPSAHEVVALHELPLAGFLDPANLRIEHREAQGHVYELFWYTVQGTVVWGATARILHQLLQLGLGEGPGPGPHDWPLSRPGMIR
jgi:8-oxo-dGTP pyrophosphatase MutT (NUDIX family)